MDGNNPHRFRNYFEYNGEKHYTGTVILTKYSYKDLDYKATFVCYDYVTNRYVLKKNHKTCFSSPGQFKKDLIAVTNIVEDTVKMPTLRLLKDSQIPGLTAGWSWYIILMIFCALFNDRIGLWFLISVVFWKWRAGKVHEAGWRVDW